MDQNIDDGWHFVGGHIDGSSIEAVVDLPHTWNAHDASAGYEYYRGTGTYTKSVQVPSESGKRYFLHFEAAQSVADVSVNGTHVGQHRGGYTAFAFEITGQIRGGENRIEVIVNNEAQEDVIPLAGDFPLFGGIHRSVRLITTEDVCITPLDYASPGVYIRQRDVSRESAKVDVTTKVSNGLSSPVDAQVRITIRDQEGTPVGQTDTSLTIAGSETAPVLASLTVASPSLWHGRKSPYLYSVTSEVVVDGRVVDTMVQPLGFRTFRFDADKGFFLNGEHTRIKGIARHQDVKGRGNALLPSDHRRDLEHILDMGTNSVRLSHYPHSELFYDLCDSSGLTVYTEIPWVGSNDTGYNDSDGLKANIRQSMIEMIRQNYNHPSVILWGVQNELHNPETLSPLPYIRQMHDLAKVEDPDRPTAAANIMMGNMVGTDVTGWNKYFGWYIGHSPQIGDWMDETHEALPDVPLGITEYGAGGSRIPVSCMRRLQSGFPHSPGSVHAQTHGRESRTLGRRGAHAPHTAGSCRSAERVRSMNVSRCSAITRYKGSVSGERRR